MIIDRERTILAFYIEKKAILDYENIGLKNSKIGDREKVFADDLDRKEAFQDFLDNSR